MPTMTSAQTLMKLSRSSRSALSRFDALTRRPLSPRILLTTCHGARLNTVLQVRSEWQADRIVTQLRLSFGV
jgi:hypothetical protein